MRCRLPPARPSSWPHSPFVFLTHNLAAFSNVMTSIEDREAMQDPGQSDTGLLGFHWLGPDTSASSWNLRGDPPSAQEHDQYILMMGRQRQLMPLRMIETFEVRRVRVESPLGPCQ